MRTTWVWKFTPTLLDFGIDTPLCRLNELTQLADGMPIPK
jgi:hypothetical protein